MSEQFTLTPKSDEEIKTLIHQALDEFHSNQESKKKDFKPNNRLISRKELVDMLGISEASLYRRMRDGTLPYTKIGRKVVFQEQKILDLINKQGVNHG